MNKITKMKVAAQGGIGIDYRFNTEGEVIPGVYEIRNKGHEVAVLDLTRPFGVEVRVPCYADHARDRWARFFSNKVEAVGFVDVDSHDRKVSTYHDAASRAEARATFWVEYSTAGVRIHVQTADKADLRVDLEVAVS